MKGMRGFCKKMSGIRDDGKKKWRERKSNKLVKNDLNKKSGEMQRICFNAYSRIKNEGKKDISKPKINYGDKEKITSSFISKNNSGIKMVEIEVTPSNHLLYKELKNGKENRSEALRLEEFSEDFLYKKINSFL